MKTKFTEIYAKSQWGSSESKSGTGSELRNTAVLRAELPFLISKYDITSMLDIPCGDFNWMRMVDLSGIDYIGADIVEPCIASNRELYPDRTFKVLDITRDALPKVDLIFVRDCLGHLSTESIKKALAQITASGSTYLLCTSFTKWNINPDIQDGGWRCANLMIPPFNLKPIYLINEDCREGYPSYNDKCMILVRIDDMYSL